MKKNKFIVFLFFILFYLNICLIGYFYGFKLALLIFLTIVSYKGFFIAKEKLEQEGWDLKGTNTTQKKS